jgi:hypothetical protein
MCYFISNEVGRDSSRQNEVEECPVPLLTPIKRTGDGDERDSCPQEGLFEPVEGIEV